MDNTKIMLTFKGMDNWDRPVYEDESGRLWKDVDPRKNKNPDLCTSQNNEFYGEPLASMYYMKQYDDVEIEFIPERVTW